MHPREKGTQGQIEPPSKDLPPFPENFGPVFFKNQFRTRISLPTKEIYPNMEELCGIVTGSNTGLGFESAKQLLSLGLTHLVMAVRSIERGTTAAKELLAVNSSAKIDVWQLDMESYDSIRSFARKCKENLSRIDFVILNAGIAPLTFATVPATKHERTVQVNHISTAFLAILLLPILKSKSPGKVPPRLTIVNSVTAHLCKFPNKDKRPLLASFDDTTITPFDPEERYGVSKLLSQLFIVRLAEIVNSEDVIINMVDPGLTKGTRLSRDANGTTAVAAKMFFSIAGRRIDKGAATYIDAVLGHGKETHGCFLMNCQISSLSRWYYSDGKALTDSIWAETLQELNFIGAAEIISSMSSDI
ncbi:hypothetical protein PISL3812_00014 [Talaromyces islandicus]|uniref:Short-chain dehydrogenase/reductase family protein n=1 Tax=Talaromyces islandicus TaxID=28573 RepID=A0A0U1LJZ9_TALIS|nr:hypothetical protein PISL3812_00014 [Talaromyces islandicus]